MWPSYCLTVLTWMPAYRKFKITPTYSYPLATSHLRCLYLIHQAKYRQIQQYRCNLDCYTKQGPPNPATMWNISFLLYCWLGILSVDGLHLWLLGALLYWSRIGLENTENGWGVLLMYRHLLRKIQYFGLIWVVGDLLRIKHWRCYIPYFKKNQRVWMNLIPHCKKM